MAQASIQWQPPIRPNELVHVIPVPPTEKKECLLHPNDRNAPLLIQQNNKMAYNDNIFEG